MDEKGMGKVEGSPALGTNGEWQRAPMVGPAMEMQDLGLTPGTADDAATQGTAPLLGTRGGPGARPLDTSEVVAQQANTPGQSVKIPKSPFLWIQPPSSSAPFDVNCAPSQAPTLDSGRFDHLSRDQQHEM